MIQMDEREYQRLKEIERRYLQMVQDGTSAADTPPEPVLSHAEDVEEVEPTVAEAKQAPEPEDVTQTGPVDFAITSESAYCKLDAWRVLNRLGVLFKLSDAPQEPPRDNLFWLVGELETCRFSANDFQTNGALKTAAQRLIWSRTNQCELLDRVREAKLEELSEAPEALIGRLFELLRKYDGLLLLAVVHRLSERPHVHLFWMDHRGRGRSLSEMLAIALDRKPGKPQEGDESP